MEVEASISITKKVLTLIQIISARLIGQKRNYLTVPPEILSWIKVDRIYKMGHLLPSIIISVLIATRLIPMFSETYSQALAANGSIIPIAFIISFIPTIILTGIIIEKILITTNHLYRSYIKNEIQL